MSNNPYDLDLDTVNSAGANIGLSHDSLPFPAPVFYVINGQAAYQTNPVQSLYFGGWAVDSEKYAGILAQANRKPYSLLQPASISSRTGKAISIFTSRILLISPVCNRTSWMSKDNRTRFPAYQEGTRRHVQMLCVLADKGPDGKYFQWGPAILSAKGYQAKKVLGFLDEWSKHTAEIRAKSAAGLPAFLFYMAVGTTSAKREVENVGTGSQTSPITPLTVYKPEMSAEKLERLYGGEALLTETKRLQEAAATWIKSWDTEASGLAGNSFTGSQNAGGNTSSGAPSLDEIPF